MADWTPPASDRISTWTPPASDKDTSNNEPGWFEPGSKSEAAVRGFAKGATFGLAPQLSALLRSKDTNEYRQNEQAYRAADKSSEAANPMTSMISSIFGGAPAALATGGGSIARQAATNAALGAASSFGSSEKTGLGAIGDAAGGAAVGGTIGGVLGAGGKAISTIANRATKTRAANNLSDLLVDIETAKRNTPSRVPALETKLKDIVSSPEFTKIGATDKMIAQEAIEALDTGTNFAGNKLYSDLTNRVINKTTPGIIDTLKDAGKGALYTGGAAAVSTLMGGGDPMTSFENAAKWGLLGGAGGAAKNALIKGTSALVTSELPNISKAANAAIQMGVQGATSATPNPFGTLTDYLDHARDSQNPDVIKAAQDAQAQADAEDDEAAKRRAAMSLGSTPIGRAVTNTDSPIR